MIGVDELVHLFCGDDESFGYAHQELVIELCSRSADTVIPTVEWVASILYPGIEVEALDKYVRVIVEEGVQLWYRRGRVRHRP